MKTILFVSIDTKGFSGQEAAARIAAANLNPDEWRVETLRLPAFDRNQNTVIGFLSHLTSLAKIYTGLWFINRSSYDILHLNLGQTRQALVRDGIPLVLLTGWRNQKPAVVSFNGSSFMAWSPGGLEARCLRILMRRASGLTVVSQRQKDFASSLGIPKGKIFVVSNACDAPGLTDSRIEQKQVQSMPISVLFLSNLISTKGYPIVLEALELLGNRPGVPLDAVLCGRITIGQRGEAFDSERSARNWIENISERINRSKRVRIRWIEGADGEDKWRLLEKAQIFVFPTSYSVEAQPLVLLEAMAYGCAIITTNAGEIGVTVNRESAIILDKPDVESTAQAIERLSADVALRLRLTKQALCLYTEKFTRQMYSERWSALFASYTHDDALTGSQVVRTGLKVPSVTRFYCTYFDGSFFTRAVLLLRSLGRHVDAFKLYCLCLDRNAYDAVTALKDERVIAIPLEELEAADTEVAGCKVGRTKVEYYFSLTAAFCLHLLQRVPEGDVLTYLDADLYLMSSPESVYAEFGGFSIGICAHRFPWWLRWQRRVGIYNVGWLSFRRDINAERCLRWWREKCIEWCFDRVEDGRYADQRYLDSWPSLFDRVHIFTSKGLNTAGWNVGQYRVHTKDGAVFVDEDRLICFHFAGIREIRPNTYATNSGATLLRMDGALLARIYRPYLEALSSVANMVCETGGHRKYGQNQKKILATLRGMIRKVRMKLFAETVTVSFPPVSGRNPKQLAVS